MSLGFRKAVSIVLLVLGVSACSTKPVYINEAVQAEGHGQTMASSPIHFKFDPAFHRSPPSCIAVMPLSKQVKTVFLPETDLAVSDLELELLRRALYSHLAPHSYKDVELDLVNQAVKKYSDLPSNYRLLSEQLKCDTLLFGEVTDYETQFFGIYSQTSVGIKLRLIRAKDNYQLWEGRHIATSHGGSFPLTPVDIAMGLYWASSNVSEEQIVRVSDDLFRRLLLTLERDNDTAQYSVMPTVSKVGGAAFYVKTNHLTLRSGPGMKFSASIALKQNEVLTLLNERHTPWLQVKMSDGQLGYVHQRYLAAH
jgi:hypothetical protein